MKTIQIIAEIGKVETQVDGLKMVVYTNEASNEDLALLIGSRGKQGMLLFKADDVQKFNEDEIKDLPDVQVEPGEKTPSQVMRNVIYRLWEANTNQKQPFPDYYKAYMFTLTEKVKEKIQP